MQQAIPQATWPPPTTTTTTTSGSSGLADTNSASVAKLVSENPLIVFGRRGCCMCHVVKLLLLGLGVNPPVFDVNFEDEAAVIGELSKIVGFVDGVDNSGGRMMSVELPAVFVGGKMFGGLDRVMATHITGELVPILREARAIWL